MKGNHCNNYYKKQTATHTIWEKTSLTPVYVPAGAINKKYESFFIRTTEFK